MEETTALVKPGENVLEMGRDRFNQLREIASYLAKSDLIPKHFQGKEANVFIALQFAARAGLDPFMSMQNLYVVHGRPGMEAKLAITLINAKGGFDHELEYEFVRDKGKIISCTAYTTRRRRRVDGPPVTAEMVKAEKWDEDKPIYRDGKQVGKQISKWNTMPEMMYRYRAATFFARVNCPEVLMGLQTREELDDMTLALEPQEDGSFAPASGGPDYTLMFNKMVEDKGGNPLDKAFQVYCSETARALGFTFPQLMEESLNDFDAFWASYERWLRIYQEDASAEPELAQTTSPEAREGTIEDAPILNPSPETEEKPSQATQSQEGEKKANQKPCTQAQLAMISQLLKKIGGSEEMLCQDYEIKALDEATHEQAENMIAWLRKQK